MADVPLAHQFEHAEQQRQAVHLGMWIFLATEVLFFGGLLTAYAAYRAMYPAAFAEAGAHLYLWLGALNTTVLLASSWTMALGIHAHAQRERRGTTRLLLWTAALGLVFLAVKAIEYALDAHERLVPGPAFRAEWASPRGHAQLFFVLYFVLTGLHALHMLIGVGVVATMAALIARSPAWAQHGNALEMVGLYWHFVDVVWIFLFPLLYLVAAT